MLKKVFLHGELATKYTPYIEIHATTIHQITSIINSNYAGFSNYLVNHMPGFHVRLGDVYKDSNTVLEPLGSTEEIHIIPAIAGSGGDNGGIIAIIGIILVAWIAPWALSSLPGAATATTAATGTALTVGNFLTNVGIALILQGVASLLFSPDAKESNAETPSNTNFNGPVNTIRQGQPVPIGYGTLMIGSALISGGIESIEK